MTPTHVVIEEVAAESREIVVEGRDLLRGRKLSSLLEEVGGYEGEVTQPSTGKSFAVSLEPWRGRDPEATWLAVSFITDR